MKAIVYTSKTGHTKEYAEILGETIGLPVFDLKNSKELPKGIEIVYLGWLCAGVVKGYKTAKKKFNIKTIGCVGMYKIDEQLENIAKVNKIDSSVKLFGLAGGLEINKLHGLVKTAMSMMKKSVVKGLTDKETLTADEEEILGLMKKDGSLVSKDNLSQLVKWVSEN